MPNELFGSVGFALSADRRRPKTLAGRLTKEVRNRQALEGYRIDGPTKTRDGQLARSAAS
jgi:hypothetical protein